MNKYSYSKIQEFINCPYKYKLLYIDKLKREKSKYTSFGLSIEDSLEFVYNNHELYKHTQDYVIHLLKLFWIPKQYKKEYKKEETYSFLGYASKKEEKEYFFKGVSYIYEYFTYNKPERQLAFELAFEVPYKNWMLTGRIDHIKSLDNNIILIDNKVSSYIIYNIVDSIQLGIYLYALKVLYPRLPVNKAGFYYIPLQKSSYENVSNFNIKKTLKTIENTILLIEQKTRDLNFQPKVNSFCKFCRFKNEPTNEENYEKCRAC